MSALVYIVVSYPMARISSAMAGSRSGESENSVIEDVFGIFVCMAW